MFGRFFLVVWEDGGGNPASYPIRKIESLWRLHSRSPEE